MKKRSIIAGLVLGLVIAAAAATAGDDKQEFKVIQKAVKQDAGAAPVQEVKWFKVLVTNVKTGKEEVKITLPIALVEAVLNSCGEKQFMGGKDKDIDFKAIFAELKKAGPLALVEVNEEDELIKIWLE